MLVVGGDPLHRKVTRHMLEKAGASSEAVDDGWVLQRARHYRGRIQVEDEEAAVRRVSPLSRAPASAAWTTMAHP